MLGSEVGGLVVVGGVLSACRRCEQKKTERLGSAGGAAVQPVGLCDFGGVCEDACGESLMLFG